MQNLLVSECAVFWNVDHSLGLLFIESLKSPWREFTCFISTTFVPLKVIVWTLLCYFSYKLKSFSSPGYICSPLLVFCYQWLWIKSSQKLPHYDHAALRAPVLSSVPHWVVLIRKESALFLTGVAAPLISKLLVKQYDSGSAGTVVSSTPTQQAVTENRIIKWTAF